MAVDPVADEPSVTTTQGADAAEAAGLDPSVGVEIAETVNDFVMTQFQGGALRTQMQTQPCAAAGFIREIMTTILEAKVSWRHGWADKAEGFLAQWVYESLLRRGMPGGGFTGGTSLAEYMIDFGPRELTGSALIPEPARTLVLGMPAERAWLNLHLPSGQELADGSYKHTYKGTAQIRSQGEQMGSGIYLFPRMPMALSPFSPLHINRSGSKYYGSGVIDLIDGWIDYQSENVEGDLGQGWNSPQDPRSTLIKMVGTYRGTGPFGLWQWSDGARPGSRVYQIDQLWEDATELLEESSALCTAQWTLEQELSELGAQLSAAERLAAIEAAERKAAREEKALIGSLVVAALFLMTE